MWPWSGRGGFLPAPTCFELLHPASPAQGPQLSVMSIKGLGTTPVLHAVCVLSSREVVAPGRLRAGGVCHLGREFSRRG